MKKQNVNNKLAFNKSAVTELNDNQLNHVEGGSDPVAFGVALAVVGLFTASVALGYAMGKDYYEK